MLNSTAHGLKRLGLIKITGSMLNDYVEKAHPNHSLHYTMDDVRNQAALKEFIHGAPLPWSNGLKIPFSARYTQIYLRKRFECVHLTVKCGLSRLTIEDNGTHYRNVPFTHSVKEGPDDKGVISNRVLSYVYGNMFKPVVVLHKSKRDVYVPLPKDFDGSPKGEGTKNRKRDRDE